MLKIKTASKFKKDFKKLKSTKEQNRFFHVVELLSKKERLPIKYKNHKLIGDWTGYYECHIAPDWILIYKYSKDNKKLLLARTGSHSNLFK